MSFLGRLAGKLSRVPSSGEYFPEVDGLRFLAILPVLILHAASQLLIARGWTTFAPDWSKTHGLILRVIGTGGIGVQIFFVISGFIIALPFARHALLGAPAPKLGRYFLRRLTRIEPPYILALTAMYIIARGYAYFLPDYVAGLFYLHQIVFGTRNPINIVTWSLEAEVFFYILAPWLTRVYGVSGAARRWMLQLPLILVSSFVVHHWLIPHGPPRWNGTVITALPFFMAGVLLADVYASGLVQRSRHFAWDIAAACGGIGLVYAAGWNWHIIWLTPVMIMVVFVGAFKGRAAGRFLRLRPVTIVGGMCYSAYLWHIPMLIGMRAFLTGFVPRALPDGPAAALFCLLAVPLLIAGTVPVFYFIEKPFMNGPGSRYLERILHGQFGTSQRVEDGQPVATA